jgi:CRISPR/Cas system type I-B associated protein Csh2 (Cas7 group RAMP superfamily)
MDLMTVTDDVIAVRPAVIANSFDRSSPEIKMIDQRIAKMLGEKRPAKSIEPYANGCKSLFKHYAATWM